MEAWPFSAADARPNNIAVLRGDDAEGPTLTAPTHGHVTTAVQIPTGPMLRPRMAGAVTETRGSVDAGSDPRSDVPNVGIVRWARRSGFASPGAVCRQPANDCPDGISKPAGTTAWNRNRAIGNPGDRSNGSVKAEDGVRGPAKPRPRRLFETAADRVIADDWDGATPRRIRSMNAGNRIGAGRARKAAMPPRNLRSIRMAWRPPDLHARVLRC